MEFLLTLISLWSDVIAPTFSGIYELFNTSIYDLVVNDPFSITQMLTDILIFGDVLEWVLQLFENTAFGQMTLLTLMFGVSFGFVISFSIVKWFVGIITGS